ncbi:MAG: leucyl aminopeptidase [Alphaproteobacteria bacterium]|jgi:leucyl aminopeptidase|nr:leucyl aminopeptidase [Alphaproteobacteria bacterium]
MNISFAKPSLPKAAALVVGVAEGRALSATAARLDSRAGGVLTRAMAGDQFTGKSGQFLPILAPHDLKVDRIVLAGLGKLEKFDSAAAEKLGGAIVGHLAASRTAQASIAVDAHKESPITAAESAARLAYGASLRSYRFGKYRTKKRDRDRPPPRRLTVMVADPAKARAAYRPLSGIAAGVFLTRDLVSEPANVLFPVALAARARQLTDDGVKVQVMGEARMEKLGMGSLLGVGRGSRHESQLVVMQWNGAPKAKTRTPIAFIGKGVTFDTGGISIKASAGMEDMKWDMGGSGVVIGLMRALARRKAKVNAVGVIGLVENMPSGSAQRPGDIVTTMSGQTIEVLNTDAEGRLVLADALWYTQSRFKPRFMVDLATLTGAIIVALGTERAGLFSNDETLRDQLMAAGDAVGEKLWPMPSDAAYGKEIDCDIADMKNIGSGRGAGSVTAAKFLERFVNKVPWAHLDIAGVTWSKKGSALVPKGGTAFGVRLLDRLVANSYEVK